MSLRHPHLLTALLLCLAGCGSQPGINALPSAPFAASTFSAASTRFDASSSSVAAGPSSTTAKATSSGLGSSVPGIHLNVKNFAEVDPTLYRGGRPDDEILADMKRQGIKTDVCLMGAIPGFDTALDFVEHREADHAGVKWVNVKVPMTGTIPQSIADQFFQTVLDPANQPVYVHCMYGRDRTGVMVALYRMREDHYTGQQALQEAETFGYSPTRFPALTKFLLQYGNQP